ncbi:nitrilase [Sulfolobales archaeon HS-7]|nr:nitrilase [Sulfolobales archaeon HS-7]
MQTDAENAISLTKAALDKGAQVVLLPEKWTENIDNAQLKYFEELAKTQSAYIIPGALEDGISVVAPIIFPDGSLRGLVKKNHLFKNETGRLIPGNKVGIFTVGGVKMGVEICYDLDFPEVSRELAKKGAEIILVPAKIRKDTLHIWRKYMEIRALENRIAIVSANNFTPPEFMGGSTLVVPVNKGEYVEPVTYEIIGEKIGFTIVEIETTSYLKDRVERLKEIKEPPEVEVLDPIY